MSRALLNLLATSLVALSAGSGVLHAQAGRDAPGMSRWALFWGCWSTSSAGMVGPMVCVVPGDSLQRADFLTVEGDSVIARATVDASGQYVPYRRGGCQGVERGRWSSDSLRIYIQADYRCTSGATFRSDAVMDLTHQDAFSFIEGSSGTAKRLRVVNFIVQHDTLVYPDEVKRRLPGYRALSQNVRDLEQTVGGSGSLVADFGAEVPFFVLDAWMQNRGGSAVFALVDPSEQRKLAKRRTALSRSLFATPAPAVAWEANGRVGGWPTWGADWGAQVPMGYVMTPFSVGFGQPYGPLTEGIAPSAGSFPFRWP